MGTNSYIDITGYDNLGLKLGVFQPLDGAGQLVCHLISEPSVFPSEGCLTNYLGVAALVREVAGMDEDVALGELDGRVMGIRDADDASPPQLGRCHLGCGVRGRAGARDNTVLSTHHL